MESGPFIHAGHDSLSFIAEQVSHHPPGLLSWTVYLSKKVLLGITYAMFVDTVCIYVRA